MKHRKDRYKRTLLWLAVLLLTGLGCTWNADAPAPVQVTQEPIYTPAPTAVDIYAYYDWTETVTIRVYDHRADKLIEMDLEEYVVGVASGEMPAYYEPEALKAQAIATRTYTLYRVEHGGCHTHPEADVCTNSSCCQAFSTKARMQERWGDEYAANYNRIAAAVMETAGQVLTYNGKLCDALYHACSGGQTEDSEHVYANAIPYLRGVDSPYEDPMRENDVEFGTSELVTLLTAKYPDCGVTEENVKEAVRIISTYPSGRVQTFAIGSVEITGKEANRLFELKTAMFTVTPSEDGLVFHTKGYGHGVGLSQNGANGMAKHGATYEQILLHYYTGVSITDLLQQSPAPDAKSTGLPLVPEG